MTKANNKEDSPLIGNRCVVLPPERSASNRGGKKESESGVLGFTERQREDVRFPDGKG